MLVEQTLFGDAAGAGSLDIAGSVGGDHVGTHQADEYARRQQSQCEGRKHRVTQYVDEHGHIAQLKCVDDVETGWRDQSGEFHFAAQ